MNLVRIYQLNCGKGDVPSTEIRRRLTNLNIDFMLIQEPSTNKNKKIRRSVFQGEYFTKHTSNKTPRAAVWVNKNFLKDDENSCLLMEQFSDRDMVSVKTHFKINNLYKTVILCSIYMPSKNDRAINIKNPINDKINNLMKHVTENNLDIIIGTDSNSHNNLWGDPRNDERGQAIIDFSIEHNLTIVNDSSVPTYSSGQRNSCIDLTLVSQNLFNKTINWKVELDDIGSDHRLITFEISDSDTKEQKIRTKRKTKWIRYAEKVEIKLDTLLNVEITNVREQENLVNSLTATLINNYHLHCKEKTYKFKNDMEWYSPKLQEEKNHLKKEEKKMRALFHQGSDTESIEESKKKFRELKLKYNKNIQKAKNLNYKNQMSKLENTKDTARLQKLMENRTDNKIGTLIKEDNSYTTNEEETVEELMTTHFPDCEKIIHNQHAEETLTIADNNDMEIIKRITDIDKIIMAINSFEGFKASGQDGIFPALIQKVQHKIAPILQKIFTFNLTYGYIPKAWRSIIVTFIPKEGKSFYDRAKSFRGISLSSFFLKIQEKIVDYDIRNFQLINNPINENQHAYVKGKGTDTALHNAVAHIEKNFSNNNITIGLTVDITGAFDQTGYDIIATACEKKGISKCTADWIKSMLISREIKAKMKGTNIKYKPNKGCPQGGCLSPLLWCFVIDPLIAKLRALGFKVIAYADDIFILISGKYKLINSLLDKMADGIKTIEEWCTETKLKVNPEKTKIIKFSKGFSSKEMKTIKINNTQISRVKEFKYLGVHLDENLKWNYHIQNATNKAIRTLIATNKMVGKKWGLTPKLMLWIFNQIVYPRISYGNIVWWKKTEQVVIQRKFNSIQRKAQMMMTGAVKSTPGAALNALLNMPDLGSKIVGSAMQSYLRLKEQGTWMTEIGYQNGHREIEKISAKHIETEEKDNMEPIINNGRRFQCRINLRENWKYLLHIRNNPYCWYTDGSKKDNNVGLGCYNPVEKLSISMRLSDHASVMQAEMLAIETVAATLIQRNTETKEITILSDSQAAIKALMSLTVHKKTTLRCITALNELAVNNNVTIAWVPGHSNIEGNEIADKLANEGNSKVAVDLIVPNAEDKIKMNIEDEILEKCRKKWTESTGMEHSKIFIKGYERKRAKNFINLKRKDIRVLTGLMTGHGLLKNYLYKINKTDDDTCRFCRDKTEEMLHLITECEAFEHSRTHTLKIQELDEVKNIEYSKLLKFSKETGIYDTFFDKEVNAALVNP
jgi:ribonuclease HI